MHSRSAPGSREFRDVAFGALDHEMHVEEEVRRLAQLADDGRSEGDVRHEGAVHDVPVHPFESGVFEGRQFGAQGPEIR
jgi:hypothetical protein